jgi:hypothetical protein
MLNQLIDAFKSNPEDRTIMFIIADYLEEYGKTKEDYNLAKAYRYVSNSLYEPFHVDDAFNTFTWFCFGYAKDRPYVLPACIFDSLPQNDQFSNVVAPFKSLYHAYDALIKAVVQSNL